MAEPGKNWLTVLGLIVERSVNFLLKDRVRFVGLEFSFEVAEDLVGGVGATTLVGEGIAIVMHLIARAAPGLKGVSTELGRAWESSSLVTSYDRHHLPSSLS
ncbi:MAG: hypothetical protein Q9160_000928 [Pyrenula sp. 1 TL-2023]